MSARHAVAVLFLVAAVTARVLPSVAAATRKQSQPQPRLAPLSTLRGGDATERKDGVSLEWTDLSFSSGSKKILHACSGKAAPGRLLAIMGPSGSGKTTMLNALAGNVKATKKASLTGTLLCDGEACGGAAQVDGLRLAYVQQEDTFYTQMTVRETLMFAARLRLPSSLSLEQKTARVDDIIAKLSLGGAADTIVGDVRRRGISGGERKRLAIGCELLSEPQLLFLDEPTSGLDSFQAQQVVKVLQRLVAKDGVTVVTSIHQPRGSIYNMFDDLLLLSEGRVVYNGGAAAAGKHFARLGYPVPSNINAGEHIVDIVSKQYGTDTDRAGFDERLRGFEAAAAQTASSAARGGTAAAAATGALEPRRRRGANIMTQFNLLFRRAWREVARSKAAIFLKVFQQVIIAAIFGGDCSLVAVGLLSDCCRSAT